MPRSRCTASAVLVPTAVTSLLKAVRLLRHDSPVRNSRGLLPAVPLLSGKGFGEHLGPNFPQDGIHSAGKYRNVKASLHKRSEV